MACNMVMPNCGIPCAPSDGDVELMYGSTDDSETCKIKNVQHNSTEVGSGGLTQAVVKINRIRSATVGASSPPKETETARAHNPINPLWSRFTSIAHSIIQGFVVTLAVKAARNPWSYVVVITLISLGLAAVGFFTNFNVNTDEQVIYAPFQSKTSSHSHWIKEESGFPGQNRVFTVSIHNDGDNVFRADNIRQIFEVVNEVTSLAGYNRVCSQGDYYNFDGIRTCKIMSVTRFFMHQLAVFDEIYEAGGEEAIIDTVSANTYQNMAPVDTDMILGNVVRDKETGLITSVQSFNIFFLLSRVEGVEDLEQLVLLRMAELQLEWDTDKRLLQLEYFSMRSYSDEFARAIENDLYLLPVVFFIMSGFTCLVFHRWDRVQSRSMLGVGSVVTILLSMMSSFGLMFIIGVPFTSMTQILPFVVFGVGLDDTFIITGAYFRTDPNKEPEERIDEAMQDIGLSISVTTITTMFAFILGCMSTIPAIFWLNLYAFPTIAMDFVYQITFFVALIVLDERRIQANRADCCICVKARQCDNDDWESGAEIQQEQQQSLPEKFMIWYANQLMQKWVKVVVIIGFIGYAAFCVYATSLLTQEFNFSDLLPSDSYVTDFLYSMQTYTFRILGVGIYFRGNFDQMDPYMQSQMQEYVDEISALPQFADSPPFCWFRDFEAFKGSDMGQNFDFGNMTLREQINFAFTIPAIQETYGKHVVFDEKGRIVESRCYTYLDTDLSVVKDQIQVLQQQRAVSAKQPINQGKSDWSFFTFDSIYFLWEFYAVAVEELIFTTISGVAAVCGVSFFFFPHWKAIFFVFPLISMLYINLLGTLQWAGLHINAVTYICLVISIGLMVDFIVHVLLRYYESKETTREAKVKDTLQTMGASILVGGLSTSLGVLPLALSTSSILGTVFISFFAMIALGVSHGLVFLPVLLSVCGPTSSPLHLPARELAHKHIDGSNTDDSNSDDDNDRIKSKPSGVFKPVCGVDNDRSLSVAPMPGPSAVLIHSKNTNQDESLEVFRWNAGTMAWI